MNSLYLAAMLQLGQKGATEFQATYHNKLQFCLHFRVIILLDSFDHRSEFHSVTSVRSKSID